MNSLDEMCEDKAIVIIHSSVKGSFGEVSRLVAGAALMKRVILYRSWAAREFSSALMKEMTLCIQYSFPPSSPSTFSPLLCCVFHPLSVYTLPPPPPPSCCTQPAILIYCEIIAGQAEAQQRMNTNWWSSWKQLKVTMGGHFRMLFGCWSSNERIDLEDRTRLSWAPTAGTAHWSNHSRFC